MSELRAQNFMALDAPCEDKLSTMVTEYNKLADQWTDLRSQLAEREAEVKRLGEAGGALRLALERTTANYRHTLRSYPVRDVEETFAEAKAALATWHTATGGTNDD